MAVTWVSHGCHMAVTWLSHGCHAGYKFNLQNPYLLTALLFLGNAIYSLATAWAVLPRNTPSRKCRIIRLISLLIVIQMTSYSREMAKHLSVYHKGREGYCMAIDFAYFSHEHMLICLITIKYQLALPDLVYKQLNINLFFLNNLCIMSCSLTNSVVLAFNREGKKNP